MDSGRDSSRSAKALAFRVNGFAFWSQAFAFRRRGLTRHRPHPAAQAFHPGQIGRSSFGRARPTLRTGGGRRGRRLLHGRGMGLAHRRGKAHQRHLRHGARPLRGSAHQHQHQDLGNFHRSGSQADLGRHEHQHLPDQHHSLGAERPGLQEPVRRGQPVVFTNP